MNTSYPIHLFDISEQKIIQTFENEPELLTYLLHLSEDEKLYGRTPHINYNGKDTYFDMWGNEKHPLRRFMFITNDMKPIDIRDYEHKVRTFTPPKRLPERSSEHKYGALLHIDYCCIDYHRRFRYRIDPVPDTRRYAKHYCGIRHMRYLDNIRESYIDEEYRDLVKIRKRAIVTVYDDIPRRPQRSWKAQTKKRHQWI